MLGTPKEEPMDTAPPTQEEAQPSASGTNNAAPLPASPTKPHESDPKPKSHPINRFSREPFHMGKLQVSTILKAFDLFFLVSTQII